MLFLTPDQQCPCTEGRFDLLYTDCKCTTILWRRDSAKCRFPSTFFRTWCQLESPTYITTLRHKILRRSVRSYSRLAKLLLTFLTAKTWASLVVLQRNITNTHAKNKNKMPCAPEHTYRWVSAVSLYSKQWQFSHYISRTRWYFPSATAWRGSCFDRRLFVCLLIILCME